MDVSGFPVGPFDGALTTAFSVAIALVITMIVALFAALTVAAEAAGAASTLVRSAGRSARAVPPVVTGCAVAVIAAASGATNIIGITVLALFIACLPSAAATLVETFNSRYARRRLFAAAAAGASPRYIAFAVHIRGSVRLIGAVALRTAARMCVETAAIVVALAGVAGAFAGGPSPANIVAPNAPFAVIQFFASAAHPEAPIVAWRAIALVVLVLALHAAARMVEGEPHEMRSRA
jgi:ABC-type phosphate transport system permease subunit